MNDDHGGMCADGTHVASHIDLSGLEIGATYFLEVRAYSSNVGEYEISLECPFDTTDELTTAIPETTEVPTVDTTNELTTAIPETTEVPTVVICPADMMFNKEESYMDMQTNQEISCDAANTYCSENDC